MHNSTKNYESYFDEEETGATSITPGTTETPETADKQVTSPEKKKEFYKAPFSKPRRSSNDNFERPEAPISSRKLIKDVYDLKEMNMEEMNHNNIENTTHTSKGVEKYESLDHLYQTYDDENMEYEVVDLQDLQNFLGNEFKEELLNMPVEEQIALLEKEFEEDPQNYNTLYKLIYMYRTNKQKDKLKQMREHTLNLFPLGEDMWKEWIEDELNELNVEDFEKKYEFIQTMFQRALKDFYCKIYLINYTILDFNISKKYLKYLINLHKECEIKNIENYNDKYPELTIENITHLFEEFLETWGLDFNSSCKLWDLYLEFENYVLEKFRKLKDDVNYNHTLNTIRSIYRRRLSFPHIDLDIIWNEYKKFEKNQDEIKKLEIKYDQVY
jgi:hypothetical protein